MKFTGRDFADVLDRQRGNIILPGKAEILRGYIGVRQIEQ